MKRFILCAGFGWEFSGEPFAIFSQTRLEQILKGAIRGQDISVLSFDLATGTIKSTNLTWKDGRSTIARKTEKAFDPVTIKNYESPRAPGAHRIFKDNQPRVMSITDIYQAIIDIGKTDPGSLVEVSIFSHAFYAGPILVNSMDDGFASSPNLRIGQDEHVPVPVGMRDPDDKDGRSFKDFVPPNMNDKDGALFQKAFDAKGYLWLWGCNFPRQVNKVLRLVEKNSRYSASISDDVKLKFSALKADEIESFLVLNNFFHIDRQELIKTMGCTVEFKAIKDALWAGVSASYVYQLATRIGIRTIGALYGTYADFYGGVPKLMAISGKTLRHVDFYRRHFNFRTDSEGRNYGVFEPRMTRPQ